MIPKTEVQFRDQAEYLLEADEANLHVLVTITCPLDQAVSYQESETRSSCKDIVFATKMCLSGCLFEMSIIGISDSK